MKATKTKKHVSRRLRRFARANEAVSALEYAILVGVIAVGIGATLLTFETEVEEAIDNIGGQIDGINVPAGTTLNPSRDGVGDGPPLSSPSARVPHRWGRPLVAPIGGR